MGSNLALAFFALGFFTRNNFLTNLVLDFRMFIFPDMRCNNKKERQDMAKPKTIRLSSPRDIQTNAKRIAMA